MKKRSLTIIAILLLIPMWIFGQTYQSLWKQVKNAEDEDLPQTAMKHLAAIEKKANAEKAYGQLMKASLYYAKLQNEVAPDSLKPSVERIEKEEAATKDPVLRAVYDAVLYRIYRDNHSLSEDDWKEKVEGWRTKALANPDALGKVKDKSYEPFVEIGKDADIYDNDMLSVIGYELKAWDWMHAYYEKTGNRPAACLTALTMLEESEEELDAEVYIEKLDSLINQYQDLPVAGELAIARYNQMSNLYNITAAEKVAYLDMAVERWSQWKRIGQLRNNKARLITSKYSADIPLYVQMPNKEQTIKLYGLRHLSSLTMRVYRTDLKGDNDINPQYKKDYEKIKDHLVEVKEAAQSLTFSYRPEYEIFKDSLQLKGLPAGVYMLEFTTNPGTTVHRLLYYVTGLRVLAIGNPESSMRYIVVDAQTGQPIKGAKVKITPSYYYDKKDKDEDEVTLETNAQGEVSYQFKKERRHDVFAYTRQDEACPSMNASDSYRFYDNNNRREYTHIYTDRAIYRPGQTVQVAAIIYALTDHVNTDAVVDKKMTMTLRDANYKVIAEKSVTTDHYGKCSAEFTLPKGSKNGSFRVSLNGSSQSFRVEEYKRPTFEVSFSEYKEMYKAGDTITVQGKAVSYAGVPVQDAKVKYTVRRRIAYWWMSYSWYWNVGYIGRGTEAEELLTKETTTHDDGTFDVMMPMVLPKDDSKTPMFYTFEVEADVTDQAGETHGGTKSMSLGTRPTALTCDVPQRIRRDQIKPVTFYRRNAAGNEIEGTVRYRIDEGKWQEVKANTGINALSSQLKSGEHRLEAACEGDSIKMKFIIFGLDDKKPAIETNDWFYISDSRFPNDGKPVTLQVGSSDPDLYIAYEIMSGSKVIEQGFVRENSSLLNRKFTYNEEYGNGLFLTYAWVKDGKAYQHKTTIGRPLPDKQLTLKWETFRDRLKPGQQEEWRLSIKDKDGKPADAQLMAVLYDKSLDQLAYHYWGFYPNTNTPLPSTSWYVMSFGGSSASGEKAPSTVSVPDLKFSTFDYEAFPEPRIIGYGLRSMGGRVLMKSAANDMVYESAPAMMAVEEDAAAADQDDDEEVLKEKEDVQEEKQDDSVQLRENMQETAFFYPALVADKEGNVTLKFTLPESLTTWRFMGLAVTPDMNYGRLGGETVAQKDVMIQPNMPRFVRMGDKAQLSARIFNISEQAQQGTARIELLDPETEKVIFTDQQDFTIEAGKTGHATFSFEPDHTYSLLICRMSVKGADFSDGEQHYLPILPDQERVTKSVPFTQHEQGVKAIDLTKLFPEGTAQQKLTVEYTNNPAWLMVQSLATLGQPHETSAIDQAASYYSNMLAMTILKQTPSAKKVFEQWKMESGNETSLNSNLEKNQELKDIILSETPWVNAADRETEQKQRLADFFDENKIDYRLSMAMEKLQNLQQGDGGFSWYPGMPSSPYITMSISEMMARLHVMTGTYGEAERLQERALDFVDDEIVDIVNEMKKREKKGLKPYFPSHMALSWLYVNAIDKRKLSKKAKEASDYLMPLLKKDIKNQTIYEKAMTAIVLLRQGDVQKAHNYVKSLKEYTVYTEEMGRYYDTRRASYSWYSYKIPTEVAAIEAIKYVEPDDTKTIDEMRRWLLQEKRTQMWDTPISSVNAIYAFLFDHANLLATQEATVLAIDQQPIELPKETAGIGYVKTAIQDPKGKEFTATKTSTGTSWGAVYAQFMQKTSEVEDSQSGITVKREIIPLNTQNNQNTQNTPNTLKVGDRIKVRITIETTRDLDFVQVLDRRAACMEPVHQLSGYHRGAYVSPKDFSTNYYYGGLAKGKYVLETDYFIDRAGTYETGTCTVQCAYSPEYRATAHSATLVVTE